MRDNASRQFGNLQPVAFQAEVRDHHAAVLGSPVDYQLYGRRPVPTPGRYATTACLALTLTGTRSWNCTVDCPHTMPLP